MIAILKVGYNVFILGRLILIFDTEDGQEQAAELRIRQILGGKAHIMDAIDILSSIL